LIACCTGCFANAFCAAPPCEKAIAGVVMITIGRFVAGLTIGLQAVTVPVYIAEFVPSSKRGFYGLFHQLAIVIAILLAILLGVAIQVDQMPHQKISNQDAVATEIVFDANQQYIFTPSKDEDFEEIKLVKQVGNFECAWWRTMQVVPLLALILQATLLLTKFKSDTPCMNVQWGEVEKAKKTLLKIMENEEEAEKVLQDIVAAQEEQKKQKEQSIGIIKALRSSYYQKGVIIGIVCAVVQSLSGVNILIATSTAVFKSAGLKESDAVWASVGMGAFNVLMTLPPLWLTDTFGRRTLLLVSFAGQTACLLTALIFELTGIEATWKGIVVVVCFITYLGFFAIGTGPIIWLYLSEIFPMEIRSKVMSMAVCGNWIANFAMVSIGILVPSSVLYGILVGFNVFGLAFVFKWIAETKGLSLEKSPLFPQKLKPRPVEDLKKEEKRDEDMELRIVDGVETQL